MCGIFSYLGNNPEVLRLLIEGLQRLEYRGYDSAGVCVHNGNVGLLVEKSAGKVANLRDLVKGKQLPEAATYNGISHTRWATHGKPNDVNAHPHMTKTRKVAVVHNGIIENYSQLKDGLEKKGYEFFSETDSEVLAVLVEDLWTEFPENDLPMIVSAAVDVCVGTFGAVFLFDGHPDRMIGCRRGSPLILGLVQDGEKPEYFLASDACAIVQHTRDVIYINDGETVECTSKSYCIHDTRKLAKKARKLDARRGNTPMDGVLSVSIATGASTDNIIDNPIVRLEMQLEEIEKGGFDHFMLKEIFDQSTSLSNCLRGRLQKVDGIASVPASSSPRLKTEDTSGGNETHALNLSGLEHVLPNGQTVGEKMLACQRIVIVACGTSWHSALIGEYFIEQMGRIPCEVEYASEFRYRKPLIKDTDVILGISQSGETADTLEALRLGAAFGATTFGVVNVVGSTIARETTAGMYIHAGPEVGVASTKAFTGQVLSLFLIGLYLAQKGGQIVGSEYDRLVREVLELPKVVDKVIQSNNDQTYKLAREVRLASNFLFLGRGLNFPVALEGALRMKEISYIHAEGYPAAEMKHGPIALIDQFMPVVIIAPRNDPTYIKVKANIEEVHARNGSLIVITDEGNDEFDRFTEYVIKMPLVDQYLQPIINVLPLQLLSYYVAKMRLCAIDQPRNLAKSVTVE